MEAFANDTEITVKINSITMDRLSLIAELLGYRDIERVAQILLEDAAKVVLTNAGV
jgi:hypothetical protein